MRNNGFTDTPKVISNAAVDLVLHTCGIILDMDGRPIEAWHE